MEIAESILPSSRVEPEITDVNQAHFEPGELKGQLMGQGFAWLDSGTHDSLMEAGQFVHTIENRQGLKVACLEEIGSGTTSYLLNVWRHRLALGVTGYGQYLQRVLESEAAR